MTLTASEYQATRHFGGLNGLRNVAICAVVWHHCYYAGIIPLKRGFLGVDLFFALSGFLIMTLLLRERDATGTNALGRFWIRRSLRLVPAVYALLTILAVFYAVHKTSPHARSFFVSLPANALYLSNWVRTDALNLSILWSLATEQQFYIVWPLIERFLRAFAWPALLLFLLLNQLVNFHLLDPFLTRILPHRLADYEILGATYTPICLGVALARLLHNPRSFAVLRTLLGKAVISYAIAMILALILWLAPGNVAGFSRLIVQILMTALIGALVLQPDHRMTKWLDIPMIARVGIISYGIYLYHLWALHMVRAFLTPKQVDEPILLFCLTMAVSIVMAEVSYRWFEKPILAFAHRFKTKGSITAD